MSSATYPEACVARIDERSRPSVLAKREILFALFKPRSVVDFGCGSSVWLAVAESLGAYKLLGIDGNRINPSAFASNQIGLASIGFEKAAPALVSKVDRRFRWRFSNIFPKTVRAVS